MFLHLINVSNYVTDTSRFHASVIFPMSDDVGLIQTGVQSLFTVTMSSLIFLIQCFH